MTTQIKNADVLTSAQFNTSRNVTVTPISLKEKDDNGSKDNFEIEQKRQAQGYNPLWTDAPECKSQVGDLFAFVVGAGTLKDKPCEVHLHRIVAILPNSVRDGAKWNPTCNQHKITEKDRNILVLSPVLVVCDWETFADCSGKARYVNRNFVDSNNPQRLPVRRTASWSIK